MMGILLCLFLVSILTVPASAAQAGCSVYLSVEKRIKGDKPPKDAVFSFELRPVGDAPMPQYDTIQMTGVGTKSFQSIHYTQPGNFQYTLSELPGKAKGYTYDETVYYVTVQVTTDDDGALRATVCLAEDQQGAKVEKAVFCNGYKSQKRHTANAGGPPDTGDTFPMNTWLTVGGASLLGIILVITGYWRKNRKNYRPE